MSGNDEICLHFTCMWRRSVGRFGVEMKANNVIDVLSANKATTARRSAYLLKSLKLLLSLSKSLNAKRINIKC